MTRAIQLAHPGLRHDDGIDLGRIDIALTRGVRRRLRKGMIGVPTRDELDRHLVENLPSLAEPGGDMADVLRLTEHLEKTGARLEDVLPAGKAQGRSLGGIDAQHGGQPRMVLTRSAGIGRRHDAADGSGRQREGVRHLCGIQLHQTSGCHCTAKYGNDAAMEALLAQTRNDSAIDATGSLVTEDDGSEDCLSAGAGFFSHRQRSRSEGGARVDNIAKIAVVGGCGVAHQGVDARGGRNWQLGRIAEPHGRLGHAATLLFQRPHDFCGFKRGTERRAGNGAGYQHGRILHCARRQIDVGTPREKNGKFARNGHMKPLCKLI